MATIAHDYRDLYLLDAREQIIVLDGIAAAGARLADPELLEDVRLVRAQVTRVLDLKDDMAREGIVPAERRDVHGLDREIEGRVSLIHGSLKAAADSPLHPLHAAADQALTSCFPHGLTDHVNGTFVDKRSFNERMIERLVSPELAAAVDGLSLRRVVEELVTMSDEFARIVLARVPVDRAVVDTAERLADEMMLELVSVVISRNRVGDLTRVARRDELLAEVLAMQDRKRAKYVEAANRGVATRVANEAAADAASPPPTAAETPPPTAAETPPPTAAETPPPAATETPPAGPTSPAGGAVETTG